MPEPYDPLKGNTRAMGDWDNMVTRLEDMGFTVRRGKSAWTFTCRHGRVKFTVYRNLKAWRNGDWLHAPVHASVEEGRKCR